MSVEASEAGANIEADGFAIKGSIALHENIFVTAQYAPLSLDISFDGVKVGSGDLDITNFGIGYNTDINDSTSFYASYTIGTWELGGEGGGEDLDVDSIRIGVRSQLTSALELNGSIASHDMEGESETGFEIGIGYKVTDTVQLTASYEQIDEFDFLNFGARMTF